MNFDCNREIKIMGIVNITDDSFFSDSRCVGDEGVDMHKVKSEISQMLEDGASIIDLGACSTRPGSASISEEGEWSRLEPVLHMVMREFPEVSFSIDTFRASVVERAWAIFKDASLAKVPLIINDISAGEDDPMMLPLVGRLGLPYIAMHKRGTPEVMQNFCDYPEGVVQGVYAYFHDFAAKAAANGIKEWILDPGFGFSKTIQQNYDLLAGMDRFLDFGREILVGVSRKSMIWRLFGISPHESLPETQVLHLEALQMGASILRVHDVLEAVHTREIYKRLNGLI